MRSTKVKSGTLEKAQQGTQKLYGVGKQQYSGENVNRDT